MYQQDRNRPLRVEIPGHDRLTFAQQQLIYDILYAGFADEVKYFTWAHKVLSNSVPEVDAPGLKLLTSELLVCAIVGWKDGPEKQEVKRRVAAYLIRKGFRRENNGEAEVVEAATIEALQGVQNR